MKRMNHILCQAKKWIAGHRKESVGIIAGMLVLAVAIGVGIFSASGTADVPSSGRTTVEKEERKSSESVNTRGKQENTTLEKTVRVETTAGESEEKQGDTGKQVITSSGIKKGADGNASTANISSQASSNTNNNNIRPEKEPSDSGSQNSGNSNSNTGNENTQTHKHKYDIPITVDHREESHYEDKIVKDSWTEEVKELHVVCFTCGGNKIIDDQAAQHVMWHAEKGETCQYGDKEVVVDTIEHPAVTEQVKVIDQEAWTEIIGYKCICGDEKMQ